MVGSGAGGGPLAARLAIGGFSVLLIEAGDDQGALLQQQIPGGAFLVEEVEEMRWDYFVRHYANDTRQAQEYKTVYETPAGNRYVGLSPPPGSMPLGILYPRAGTLGGCAAHNLLVTVYPHDSDWDNIANITGDDSWAASSMRQYFERLEKNDYLPQDTAGHGFDGWLGISTDSTALLFGDESYLIQGIAAAIAIGKVAENAISTVSQFLGILNPDLNEENPSRDSAADIWPAPLAIYDHKRSSPRQFIVETAYAAYPNGTLKYHLDIRSNTLVTRVLFDEHGDKPKAIGVEFLEGQALYRADPRSNRTTSGTSGSVMASREVILSAGAFNTPQLLKLSGIGPATELDSLQIPVIVDLPGVGTNLQDRYEISVVGESFTPTNISSKCTAFQTLPDPCYDQWQRGEGFYTTNSNGLAITKRSSAAEADDDLILFDVGLWYTGYFPGFSTYKPNNNSLFTWTALKAHTRNTAGTVTLRSADPRDMPEIDFHYYDEGTTTDGADDKDYQAVLEGFTLARDILQLGQNMSSTTVSPFTELWPGADVSSSEQIEHFIKSNSWGHHASCTCPIGADGDPMAVLDSKFRVRGVDGLRVVDASVFPKIPGFFIVTPIYIVAEKAADVIMQDARAS